MSTLKKKYLGPYTKTTGYIQFETVKITIEATLNQIIEHFLQ